MTSWKAKRLRKNPNVEIAPSTLAGKPTGPAVRARVRLVPLFHRLMGYQTIHFELLAAA